MVRTNFGSKDIYWWVSDACYVVIETGVDWWGFHTPCFVCCFRHSSSWSPITSTSWQVVFFDHHGRRRGTGSFVICLPLGHTLNYSVTPNYIFQGRKGEEFMQKLWAPGSHRAPKSQEFLVEDDWLLLTSPKGQTAHQNLLTNLSAFFLPRFAINAHAVLSDRVNVISSPFNCWCRGKWSPFRRDKHWRRSMRKRCTSGISNKILSLSLLDNLSTRPSATFWRSGTGNKRGRHWHCHVHRLFNFQRLFQCSGCLLMIVAVTPFTGWGTATCFYSAAGSPNSKSSWNRQGVYPPGGAHSPWYPPVRSWATFHWVHLIEARTHQ